MIWDRLSSTQQHKLTTHCEGLPIIDHVRHSLQRQTASLCSNSRHLQGYGKFCITTSTAMQELPAHLKRTAQPPAREQCGPPLCSQLQAHGNIRAEDICISMYETAYGNAYTVLRAQH